MNKECSLYKEVRSWVLRNGRELEATLWNFFFEEGSKEDVVKALAVYQNEDGGFGNALEPDNWNPSSSPYVTNYAIGILQSIEYKDRTNPVIKGICRYLESGKDLAEYGWRFSISSNDDYPHAPWWSYDEEGNKLQSIGLTAQIVAFVLEYFEKDSELYKKAQSLTDQIIEVIMSKDTSGDMGINGFIVLIETIDKMGIAYKDMEAIKARLKVLVNTTIERDTTRWEEYTVRPTQYITSPDSAYYEENKDIIHKEMEYLIETRPIEGVWGITWTWFDMMEQYGKEFTITENWWKAIKAIEKMRMIKVFSE